jgi:hypothetical protein
MFFDLAIDITLGHGLKKKLVHITPDPFLAGLKRLNKRMAGGVEVLGRVLVGRRVAAAHVPAVKAHAQVNPPIARF